MRMAAPLYYTADMVRALPDDGRRYEVVRGELLVTPAPRWWHQTLVLRLARSLASYVEREKWGDVVISPADISWGTDTLVQPDVFVVPIDDARTGDWRRMQTLLLVAEVLSPGSARADRFTKRRRYQEAGVPLYWVVDGDDRSVEVWTPSAAFPDVERVRVTWHPAGAARPFSLDLSELFRPL